MEKTINGKERKVKNVGTGTGRVSQKAEHPHHAHHSQSWWMLPHDAVSRGIQERGSKTKPHSLWVFPPPVGY